MSAGSNDMSYKLIHVEISMLLGNDHRSAPELRGTCDATSQFPLDCGTRCVCVVTSLQPAKMQ
jgi:hypothetical protein